MEMSLTQIAKRLKRKRVIGQGRVIAVFALCLCLAGCARRNPFFEPPGHSITIATFNILYSNTELERIVDILSATGADIICLQETTHESERYLRAHLDQDYPYMFFHLSCIGSGAAVLSRFPITYNHYFVSTYGINGYQIVEIDIEGTCIQVANVHLQPTFLKNNPLLFIAGLMRTEAIRRKEIMELTEKLDHELPTIITGDFNSLATFKAPVYLRKSGFIDSHKTAFERSGQKKTLHFRFWGRRWGYRVDYIFHTPHFLAHESTILEGTPSDHNPVISTLILTNPMSALHN